MCRFFGNWLGWCARVDFSFSSAFLTRRARIRFEIHCVCCVLQSLTFWLIFNLIKAHKKWVEKSEEEEGVIEWEKTKQRKIRFFSLLLNSLNSSSCQPRLLKPSLTEPLTRSSVFCCSESNNKKYQKTEKSLLDDLKYTNSNTFSFFSSLLYDLSHFLGGRAIEFDKFLRFSH